MAYTRLNWIQGQTALSADNMNNIEDGIEETKSSISTLDNNKINGVTAYQNIAISNLVSDTLFTAPRTGWMVVLARTTPGQTLGAYLQIRAENNVPLASSWGVTAENATVRCGCPVKAGQQYSIYNTRCTLESARIHY